MTAYKKKSDPTLAKLPEDEADEVEDEPEEDDE